MATVLLAARYDAPMQNVVGTTIGMSLASVAVVPPGARFANRLPLRAARRTASAVSAMPAGRVAWHGPG